MDISTIIGSDQVYFQLARFFFVLFLGIFITRAIIAPLTRKLLGGKKKTVSSIENIVQVIGVFASLIVALQAAAFGDLVTIVGAMAAALTVAIGFGMRDQVANLVSGIFIQLDNPFLKNDYLKVGEQEGRVQEINMRNTIMRAPNGDKLIIPNNHISTNPVRNRTSDDRTSSTVEVAVPSGSVEEAAEILKEAAEDQEEILETPDPSVSFTDMSDGKTTLQLDYSTRDRAEKRRIKSKVIEQVSTGMEKSEIFEKENKETSG